MRGQSWSSPQAIASAYLNGPDLAAANGTLYVAWSDDNTDDVMYSKFSGTSFQSERALPSAVSGEGPGLASCAGSLYAAWTPLHSYSISYSWEP